MASLQLAQRADRAGGVWQRVVGEHTAWSDLRTDGMTVSLVALPEMAGRDLSVRGTGHRRCEGSRR